jgi:hypothetical protein
MRIVKIVEQSVKLNPHIRNVGYIGIVEEEDELYVQLEIFWDSNNNCPIKYMGSMEQECVEDYEIDDLDFEKRYAMKNCYCYKE